MCIRDSTGTQQPFCQIEEVDEGVTLHFPFFLNIGVYDLDIQSLSDRAGNSVSDRVLTDDRFRFTITGEEDTTPPEAPTLDAHAASVDRAVIELTGTKEQFSYIVINGQQFDEGFISETWVANVPLSAGLNDITLLARDFSGNESESITTQVTFNDTAPGEVPFSLSSNADGLSVVLAWDGFDEFANGADIADYLIYLSDQPFTELSADNLVETVSNGSRTTVVNGLELGQTYFATVVARDDAGNISSSFSVESVTTFDTFMPQNARLLQAQVVADDSFELTWAAPLFNVDDVDHYRVEIDGNAVVEVGSEQLTYVVENLNANQVYQVRVVTVDASDNESDGTSIQAATPYDNPTDVSLIGRSFSIEVSWQRPAQTDGIANFNVYVSREPITSTQGLTRNARVNANSSSMVVTGLDNDVEYYVAVASENISGHVTNPVTSVSVTPGADETGPEIVSVNYGSAAFVADAQLSVSDDVCVQLNDISRISRVEFVLDGTVVNVDASGSDGYCYSLILDVIDDGDHQLLIRAYDVFENESTTEFAFSAALALPAAPEIVEPSADFATNDNVIELTVRSTPGLEIQVQVGEQLGLWVPVNATGQVTQDVVLFEGENLVSVRARNRTGEGAFSSPLTVTVDSSLPAQPFGLRASALSNGGVRLTWVSDGSSDFAGFNIYRSTESFETIDQAELVNNTLVTQEVFDDVVDEDGQYYYRVTSVNSLGSESELSTIVDVISDSIGPIAESIVYSVEGEFDELTQTYGRGELSILLTVDEPLLTIPFLSISPENGAPISVPIEAVQGEPNQYQGTITLDEDVQSGTAFAVFSARDEAGNRGTQVNEGGQLLIDTQGPSIVTLTTDPQTPILNDSVNPVTVTVSFQLSEALPVGQVPTLEYRLTSSHPDLESVTNIQNIEDTQWQAEVLLPVDAGASVPENIEFSFSATDALNNVGTDIENMFVTQIYQGDLPPLGVPFNFRAQALPGGQVQLNWFEVETAVGYQLYRRGPNDADFVEHETLTLGDEFIDQTDIDGEYQYQLASIREENGQQSLSTRTEAETVITDSQAPATPTGLTLELFPIGIQTQWQPVAEDGVTYRVYRAQTSPIITTEGLTPLLSDLVEPFVVDTNANQEFPAYAVVAVDEIGNESEPSETQLLNIDLLPVSSLSVRLDEEQAPVVSWTHSRSSISEFDIFLGADETGVQLNQEVITDQSFVDAGYANNDRMYAIVAMDGNGLRSLPRSILLPSVDMQVVEGQIVRRNVINAVSVEVTNNSAAPITNARVKLVSDLGEFQSSSVTINVGETAVVPVTVAGLEDLPSSWSFSLEMHSEPNAGERIEIAQPGILEVQDGALDLILQTDEFIRGGQGKVRFELENTNTETIQLITARNNGRSDAPGVVFTLTDADDNTLAIAPFRQVLGDSIVNTASRESIANIQANQRWLSDEVLIEVPGNAPDEVFLTLQINDLYANRGLDEEVRVRGPVSRQRIVLTETSYTGTVGSVSPQSSFGNDPITIVGQAVDRATGQALPNTALQVIITVSGYERSFEVETDAAGNYELVYEPQQGEAGRYIVSVIHPILTTRPMSAEFVINRLTINPSVIGVNVPYLFDFDIPINFTAGDGTELTNVRIELRAQDQDNNLLPNAVEFTLPQPIETLGSGERVTQNIFMRAEEAALEEGQVFFAVFADQSPEEPIGLIDLAYNLTEARPSLSFSPSIVELGTTLEGSSSMTVTLENRGLVDLEDVHVRLLTTDGFPAFEWIRLLTPESIGDIAVGQERTVDVVLQPNGSAPIGNEQFVLEVASSNSEPRLIPVITAVTQDGEGGVSLRVTDMYTGTFDGSDELVQGLVGANVRFQNEAFPSTQFNVSTDEIGEIFLEDIPAGSYSVFVTAPNYQEEFLRLRIQPGLTVTEQVFLDFNLIRLEWSVEEVTIQDRYEIVLSATFETDVPAAVVMLEPVTIELPEMEVGDVFYGELQMTNYGLIRAFDIDFTPQQSDEFFQFEYLTSVVPSTLEAREVVTVPYKVTALRSLEQQDASGGGCGVYTQCSTCTAFSNCPTGLSGTHTSSCVTRSYGVCASASSPTSQSGSSGRRTFLAPRVPNDIGGTGSPINIGVPSISSGLPVCREGGAGCSGN